MAINMQDSDLKGGTVNVPGTWGWQKAGIIPAVNNSGYVAVFTPKDTTNYETVTRTITVNVTKATPYIAELPAAAGITYGDTLKDSLLSGGTAVYGDGAGQTGDGAGSTETVAGAFTWKEPSTKPVVADSNVTKYTIVFTPSDTANYNSVEAAVKLTVNKAQNAPNMLPDTGMPFIKDEHGKIGWDVIRSEEEQAQEGSTINVDMNGSAVVPGDILGSIRGRDITVTFDMGSGILWSVDGRDITADKVGDIDFSVKTGTNTIPVDIIYNVTGERYSIQLSLAHDGEFGFTAVLSIGLGKENAGYTASLYYYNETAGEMEFISADEIAEDGTAELLFTHASDYVVVVGEEEESRSPEPAQPESGSPEPAQPEGMDATAGNDAALVKSPKTGQENTVWPIVAGIIAFAGAGIAMVLAWRKKKEE